MEKKIIYLQGLNYRRSDRDAVAGDCRVLQNLYPIGEQETPSWKAVKKPVEYFTAANGDAVYYHPLNYTPFTVFSKQVWYRANLPALLIVGVAGKNYANQNEQKLVAFEIDGSGAVVTSKMDSALAAPLYVFPIYHPNKSLRFTQIGDMLIVAEIDLDEPVGLFAIVTDGTNIMFQPFNLPPSPIITGSQVPLLVGEPGIPLGWYGYRWALVLTDGTIARSSPIRVLKCTPGGETNFQFDMENTATPDGYSWNKIIRGVGLFVSERIINLVDASLPDPPADTIPASPERVFSEGKFHLVHVFDQVFNKADSFIVNNYETQVLSDDTNLMREDSLLVHSVFAKEIGSFNKSLLLGGIKYDFAKPVNLDFTSIPTVLGPQGLAVTDFQQTSSRVDDKVNQFHWQLDATWNLPDGVIGVKLERSESLILYYKNSQGYDETWPPLGNVDNTHTIFDNVNTPTVSYSEKFIVTPDWTTYGAPSAYRYSLFLTWKITAYYLGLPPKSASFSKNIYGNSGT